MYKVILSHQAVKSIKKLPKYVKERVLTVLKELPHHPIPTFKYDVKKIKGEDYTYRIRLGKYRILYEIDEKSTLAFSTF